MSDKTLVERLREVNSNRAKHPVCQIANAVGVGCGCKTCSECEMDTAHALADAIEREYLLRPRFEDGELVREGDTICIDGHLPLKVHSWSIRNDGLTVFSCPTSHRSIKTGERVKRQEPEMLDADGVTIRKGDTVYPTKQNGAIRPFEVKGFNDGYVLVAYRDRNQDEEQGDWNSYLGEQLTHKQPALDADDVPIRVGDTVYELGTGEKFEVEEITSADTFCVLVTEGWYFAPNLLTHKEPDTLERIEEDAKKITWDYWECSGIDCCDCPVKMDGKKPRERYDTSRCHTAMMLDLLRRQREVLERGSNG